MSNEHAIIGDRPTRPMEILLLEDGWTDARVTIYALRRSKVHHRLTLVRTRGEAIAFLNQSGIFAQAPRPDLLLLDMMLPDGSGLDVLRELRKTPQDDDSQAPTVVVLTASSDQGLCEECKQLGAADFMKKPVREDDFKRVVREHKRLMIHTTPLLAG